jgi:hypothetical protein
MRKIVDFSARYFDSAFRASLNTIKQAHVQLHLLTDTRATPALLASQIELYDVLLDEIYDIHASLAKDLGRARVTPTISDRVGLGS